MFADDEYTFEAFILIKEENVLKNFVLYEGVPSKRNNTHINFKKKIQYVIANAIAEKFANEAVEYDTVNNIADNQKKIYCIPTTDEYCPFPALPTSEDHPDVYSATERIKAEGVFFRYERGNQTIWAFQYFWPNAIPNRQSRAFHIISKDDVFIELPDPILVIGHKVDLLIIDNSIITDNIKLLETHYGFQEFVRSSANKIVNDISNIEFVGNMDKISEYISRSKPTYARKMLRIKNSKVLGKSKDYLYDKVTTLPRWKGKFEINEENHTIVLNSYKQVEYLIDLLDERYTRSDVTDEEYDTSAKKWIEPPAVGH